MDFISAKKKRAFFLSIARIIWVMTLGVGLVSTPLFAETATTRVLEVHWSEVVLDAGKSDGLLKGTKVTLLRQGSPLLHPVTNEVLGTPHEPVGTAHVIEVKDHTARARMTKMYSEPMVGDLVEHEKRISKSSANFVELDPVGKRVDALEKKLEKYEKMSAGSQLTSSFPSRAWDELSVMKSYLVTIDERLRNMEDRQMGKESNLGFAGSSEYRPIDYKELTLRYTSDTQLKVQAAGNAILISVVNDTVHMEKMVGFNAITPTEAKVGDEEESGFSALLGVSENDDALEEEVGADFVDEEGEGPWYKSYWHLAGGIGLVVAFFLMVAMVLRSRYNDVMDGLDEYGDDYFEDDDEE